MKVYKFSSSQKQLLNLRKKLFLNKNLELTEERIAEFNQSDLQKSKYYKKLYYHKSNDIYEKTFIVPVEDGAITCYLFEKIKHNTITGLNPLIIYFHGGGWTIGNMNHSNPLCWEICEKTGASILSVDFRLAPRFKFPTPIEDCYSALVWAAQGARYWKTDPERIYLMGTCSGANLAATVCRLSRDRKGPSLYGQILLCPVTDGRLRTDSFEKYKDCPTLTAGNMNFFVNQYKRDSKDVFNPNFSPLLAKDHSRLPQTLIISAEIDPLRDDSRLYAQALKEGDTPVKLLECKGAVHNFINFPKFTGTEETLNAISLFVGGKAVEQIELITDKQRKLENKKKTGKMNLTIS